MKLLADMLNKKAYNEKELKALRGWIDKYIGKRLQLRDEADSERFNQSLAMYLIVRDLMADLNAVGGGFMSQLEWGSDPRGIPLPVADVMESLFNSTFDHNGRKAALAFCHRSRRAGTFDNAVYDVSFRRKSAFIYGLQKSLGSVGNQRAG